MNKFWLGFTVFAQLFALAPCFGEGETNYQNCLTVEAKFKYDGEEKFCEVLARCTKCVSGVRLACDTIASFPVWCRARGASCPPAQACLGDESFDMETVKRLTEGPDARPCASAGSPSGSGAAR